MFGLPYSISMQLDGIVPVHFEDNSDASFSPNTLFNCDICVGDIGIDGFYSPVELDITVGDIGPSGFIVSVESGTCICPKIADVYCEPTRMVVVVMIAIRKAIRLDLPFIYIYKARVY
jgi:hypothetical protein